MFILPGITISICIFEDEPNIYLLNHYKVGFLPFPSPLLPFFPSPPSHQSNLLILNFSAKSSQIFTKF